MAQYISLINNLQSWCITHPSSRLFCSSLNVFNVSPNNCVPFNDTDLDMLPTIAFTFPVYGQPQSTFQVTLTSRSYMWYMIFNSSNWQYCGNLGIQATISNQIILGDTFIKSSYVVFDKTNNKVGFAAQNGNACSPNISVDIKKVLQQPRINRSVGYILDSAVCGVPKIVFLRILIYSAIGLGVAILLSIVVCILICVCCCSSRRRTYAPIQ